METKYIKELLTVMTKGGVKKLRIKKKDGSEIELERHDEHPKQVHVPYPHHFPTHHAAPKEAPPPKTEEPADGNFVTSPMVGTFYASPSPDDPNFVKVGDLIEENTIICIVEAMKVMNEVKAGIKGVVAEMLVENGHPVEFGTKLFRIN